MIARRALLKLAVGLAGGPLIYGGFSRAAQQRPPNPVCRTAVRFRLAQRPSALAREQRLSAVQGCAAARHGQTRATTSINPFAFAAITRLWGDAGLAFRLQFFHVGRNFTEPVHMYEVVDGQSHEILYDPAMFDWDKSGVDPAVDEGSRRICRLSRAVRHQLAGRRRGFLGRELFPRRRRRYAPVRLVGAGAGGRYRVSAPRGISAVHFVLVRAPGKGLGNADAVRAARFAEHRRRDAFSDRARRHADHEHRHRAVSAQADRALRHRTAHQHVLLRRERSARGKRLATGDPRLRRRIDVDRRRRVDLAAAGQPGAAAFQFVFRRQSARLRAAAAGPRFRSLPGRRRLLRSAAELVGGAQARSPNGGWGKGAVQLVEIPTVDETFDNIVVFWNPLDKPKPGQELLFSYRLYWGTKMPYSSPLGADHRDPHRHRRHASA